MFKLIFIAAIILFIIFIFIRIAVRVKRNGGCLTTTMFASTYEFLNKDKREAIEEIVNLNANKKLEGFPTGEPNNKGSS
jgi:hypothetical protein